MESKKENNNHEKIQEYSGEIPEIPSRPPPSTIVIRNGNDNCEIRIPIRQTDRFKRSSIKDLFAHGIKEKQECRRFRMRIQERVSRDRSRLEIFLPAVLCTSSLSGESMRRGASWDALSPALNLLLVEKEGGNVKGNRRVQWVGVVRPICFLHNQIQEGASRSPMLCPRGEADERTQ
jgi:hypothetical protein